MNLAHCHCHHAVSENYWIVMVVGFLFVCTIVTVILYNVWKIVKKRLDDNL